MSVKSATSPPPAAANKPNKRSNFMSRFNFKLPEKLRRISATSSSSSGPPTPRVRGRRAAFSAVHFKKEKIMKQLQSGIEKGDVTSVEDVVEVVDIAELEEGTLSFVRRACELNNLDIVAVLLRNGASVNLIGDGACTALHVAAKTGNTAMAAVLMSNCANPNAQAKYEKKSPLHVATLEGHMEVIRLLIANGADVNQPDIYGSRPLHVTCRMGRNAILQVLLENHARIDSYDNEGWTGLHLAAEAGHDHTVKLLVDKNANIDSQSKYGRTPLHWACVSGHVNVIHTLLNRGANANIKDLHEKLALHYVKTETIRTLVNHHTDKSKGEAKKYASSIGLYYNSNSNSNRNTMVGSNSTGLAVGEMSSGSDVELGRKASGSSRLDTRESRASRWVTTEQLSGSLSQESSSLDVNTIDSYHKAYRVSQTSKVPVTIIVHPEPEEGVDTVDNTGGGKDKDQPSLNTTFQKLVSTANGHLDEVDSSVGELNTILKLVSEESIEFNIESVKEYMSKLLHIATALKLMKKNFTSDSQNMKNLINDCYGEGKLQETGNPSYIALVQLLVQCIADYVGKYEGGWRVFLNHLPYPDEHSDVLAFQIQIKSASETEKVHQVIMHWARSCDIEDKVTYMRTLLASLNKCDFGGGRGIAVNGGGKTGAGTEDENISHVDKVLHELQNVETNFKSGNSENKSIKLSHMVSSLSEKDIRQLHHHIESSSTNLNVFPTLDELSVSESDNESPNKSLSKSASPSVKSINEKLEEKLMEIIENEDTVKLVISIKHLILCGREDLLTCLL